MPWSRSNIWSFGSTDTPNVVTRFHNLMVPVTAAPKVSSKKDKSFNSVSELVILVYSPFKISLKFGKLSYQSAVYHIRVSKRQIVSTMEKMFKELRKSMFRLSIHIKKN